MNVYYTVNSAVFRDNLQVALKNWKQVQIMFWAE